MSKLNYIRAERPTTSTTTVRCDIRTLATLHTFWTKQGESPRSIAEVLRLSIETFRDVVCSKDPSIEIQATADALKVLESSGLGDYTKANRRNHHALVTQLQLEDSHLDGFDPVARATKCGPVVSSQQIDMAKRMLESSTETLSEAQTRRNQELATAQNELCSLPEPCDE